LSGFHYQSGSSYVCSRKESFYIAEVQRGYRQGERLVRPAQVVVAKAAAQAEPAQTA